MITIFSTPKPFRGHFEIIQRNAIQSWLRLRPGCEIILLGNDEGTAEFNLRHVAEWTNDKLTVCLTKTALKFCHGEFLRKTLVESGFCRYP